MLDVFRTDVSRTDISVPTSTVYFSLFSCPPTINAPDMQLKPWSKETMKLVEKESKVQRFGWSAALRSCAKSSPFFWAKSAGPANNESESNAPTRSVIFGMFIQNSNRCFDVIVRTFLQKKNCSRC